MNTIKYLVDAIENNVTEVYIFDKPLQEIEKRGNVWIEENISIQGRTIVANTLLTAKIAYKVSVNEISKDMKTKINRKIK